MLDDIGVELDAAIVEEAGEAVPMPEALADDPGHIRPERQGPLCGLCSFLDQVTKPTSRSAGELSTWSRRAKFV